MSMFRDANHPQHEPARRVRMGLPAAALVALVRLYQWSLRPLIGGHCRYHPSCSEYAIAALREHGAWRGGGLAFWRILRCNPWMAGGIDPVPPRASRSRRTV